MIRKSSAPVAVNWRDLYPFRSHFLDLSGVRYHYVDEGADEPLLMVHGNPTWSFYYRRLIRDLREDYRTIAPDHVGCGLSDKPQTYSYTLDQHVQNLVQLIRSLNLRNLTLLAHDWGGAVAMGAALAEAGRVARIILFNTAAFPPPFIPLRIRACRIPWLGTYALRQWNLFARAALTMAVEQPQVMTPEVQAGLLAPYDSWEHRVAIDGFVRDIPASPRHPTWQTLQRIEAGLPSLADRPVFLIWGMRDWCFTPACLERLQLSFPQAEVLRLADAGHYVVEDAHERILPAVRAFLARHPLAESPSA